MKTTVEISDGVLVEAKTLAAREGVTLRALVELGLRRVLDDANRSEPFRLRDASVDGRGMTREFSEGGWEKIRDAIYEGHGA